MSKEIKMSDYERPEASESKKMIPNLKDQVNNFLTVDYTLVQLLPYDNDPQQLLYPAA